MSNTPRISLPKNWKRRTKSAVLHAISLAQFSLAYARGWAANRFNARVQLTAENDQLREYLALLCEETRIKDARTTRLAPHGRPHYTPTERMAMLELRAARRWSLTEAARRFQLTPTTIASWMRRIDEEGHNAMLQTSEPVNKFPDFVAYVVQRLKTLCPSMGKVKIAQTLCRAGLHLGVTTVGRMLKETPQFIATPGTQASGHVVRAKRRNHVWHVDLTVVPTSTGF